MLSILSMVASLRSMDSLSAGTFASWPSGCWQIDWKKTRRARGMGVQGVNPGACRDLAPWKSNKKMNQIGGASHVEICM